MVKIGRDIMGEFIKEGFFNQPGKTTREIIQKLERRGYMVTGRKISRITQTLAQLCRDSSSGLERENLPKKDWEKEQGRYKYVKVK